MCERVFVCLGACVRACACHHLHGGVDEGHADVRGAQVHVVARPERHAVPRVAGLHQAAQTVTTQSGRRRKRSRPLYQADSPKSEASYCYANVEQLNKSLGMRLGHK